MLSCSGPCSSNLILTGALKWGTVWTSTSTGTGIMKGQSKNFEIYLRDIFTESQQPCGTLFYTWDT